MKLTKESWIARMEEGRELPREGMFQLPEKVLQFGTGVLLRALPDYFIHKANRAGQFNGRIVVVKSTSGPSDDFSKQDNLYTVVSRGVEDGEYREEVTVCTCISRVLRAEEEWASVLECARSTDMRVVISNVTEAGFFSAPERLGLTPPKTFAGRLLMFLKARYDSFRGDPESGMVILPTELIENNGTALRDQLVAWAKQQSFDDAFVHWLVNRNHFCNTLVDRIVPGKPEGAVLEEEWQWLGYEDSLLVMAEHYRLWAIEGSAEVKEALSFSGCDPGIIVTPDITKYRELKLRLLNASHTLACGPALLAGFETVKEAMANPAFESMLGKMMEEEIAPSIPYPMNAEEAKAFGARVRDRFRNPSLNHRWKSIAVQGTGKFKTRVVPLLRRYGEVLGSAPRLMAAGLAAWLVYMRVKENNGQFTGTLNGSSYRVEDAQAQWFSETWSCIDHQKVVHEALSNRQLWGMDLTQVPGFEEMVSTETQQLLGPYNR